MRTLQRHATRGRSPGHKVRKLIIEIDLISFQFNDRFRDGNNPKIIALACFGWCAFPKTAGRRWSWRISQVGRQWESGAGDRCQGCGVRLRDLSPRMRVLISEFELLPVEKAIISLFDLAVGAPRGELVFGEDAEGVFDEADEGEGDEEDEAEGCGVVD